VAGGGSRPPPPNMRKGLMPTGPPRGPPPEVLARLRARGPPNQARMRPTPLQPMAPPSILSQPSSQPLGGGETRSYNVNPSNSRPSRLAQGGRDVLSSRPLPTVAIVNGTAAIVEREEDTVSLRTDMSVNSQADNGEESVSLGHGHWIQLWDEEVESNYYYNQQTGEASWIKPDDVVEDNGGGGGGGDSSVVSSLEGGSSIIDDVAWDRYWDDEAGAYYLHNPLTDETKWESEFEEAVSYEADSKY
jgi:hypothetical protein